MKSLELMKVDVPNDSVVTCYNWANIFCTAHAIFIPDESQGTVSLLVYSFLLQQNLKDGWKFQNDQKLSYCTVFSPDIE